MTKCLKNLSEIELCLFLLHKFFFLGSLDDAENGNCSLFYWPPYISINRKNRSFLKSASAVVSKNTHRRKKDKILKKCVICMVTKKRSQLWFSHFQTSSEAIKLRSYSIINPAFTTETELLDLEKREKTSTQIWTRWGWKYFDLTRRLTFIWAWLPKV